MWVCTGPQRGKVGVYWSMERVLVHGEGKLVCTGPWKGTWVCAGGLHPMGVL